VLNEKYLKSCPIELNDQIKPGQIKSKIVTINNVNSVNISSLNCFFCKCTGPATKN